ncbi:hypothetical protein DLH72_04820 [Candidatus Gracilibacteria bacterium]|nr:MAG: hypothetical protein DLH72_04820 [Candidatus Gracilibacteria bacterium]
MNKVEKLLEKYYSSIGELAQAFYRKYFFEEMLKNGEAKEEEFLDCYVEDTYRIGEDNVYFGDNNVFDFCCGSYHFDSNEMYTALVNNIPEKIVKNRYDERVEVLMGDSDAYFPNLYHYFINGGKK